MEDNNKADNIIPRGWMFCQTGTLILNYGFVELPWWVVWFPTLFAVPTILIVLIMLTIVAIAER